MTKLRLIDFLTTLLDSKELDGALLWEDRDRRIWKLLYYRVQEDHRVFEAWNKTRCRKEERKGTSKSFFNSALNYLKKNRLLVELKREKNYRRFQFTNHADETKERLLLTKENNLEYSSNVVADQMASEGIRTEKLSPLQPASFLNATDVVAFLSPEKVNPCFSLRPIPLCELHISILEGQFDLFDSLIKAGAPLDGLEDSIMPPLILALATFDPLCPEECYKTVQHLLASKADPNVVWGEQPLRPLVMACQLNDLELTRLLVESGADLDAGSPLTIATYFCFSKLVKFLISKKADVGRVSPDIRPTWSCKQTSRLPCFAWRSPLHMAVARVAQGENPTLLRLMLMHMRTALAPTSLVPPLLVYLVHSLANTSSALFCISFALKFCEINAVATAITESPYCLARDCRHAIFLHRSPLYIALFKKDFKIFKFLLENGANPDFSGKPYRPLICSCLPYSIPFGQELLPFLKLLIDFKGDPNKIYKYNGHEISPLNYFLNCCSCTEEVGLEVLDLMLSRGAQVALATQNTHPYGVFLDQGTRNACVFSPFSGKCLTRHIPVAFLSRLLPHVQAIHLGQLHLYLCQYVASHANFLEQVLSLQKIRTIEWLE